MNKIAVFAGGGSLPGLVADKLRKSGAECCFAALEGNVPDWLSEGDTTIVTLENFPSKFMNLYERGCRTAVLAGTIARPRMRARESRIPVILESGDDAMVRKAIGILESIGYSVVGAHEILPGLLVDPGVLTDASPGKSERRDAVVAAGIVHALGCFDVGQAAVVAQGICLGVETVQGTDNLIQSSGSAMKLLPQPEQKSGLLYKAPKPTQDLRLDFPVIGPETAINVARAGLAGIVIEANGVMVLDRAETVRLANLARLFIWSRKAEE